jgi:hypothetical protein
MYLTMIHSRRWNTKKMARKLVKQLAPMHPGEVLREEFLIPLEMSAGALAKACGVPARGLNGWRMKKPA